MHIGVFTCILSTLAVAVGGKPLGGREGDAGAGAIGVRSLNHVVHEEQPVVARGHWTRSSRLRSSTVLPLRIGLAQQNLHRAEEFMYAVSHPKSSEYGKHWSLEKIAETFAPRQESVDEVMAWLEGEGIARERIKLSRAKNWVAVNATASEVERLLRTEYHVFTHAIHGHSHVACDKYHLPEHLVEHVDMVTPTVHFDSRVGAARKNHRYELSDEQQTELKKRSSAEAELAKRAQGAGLLGQPNTGIGGPKQGATVENALMDLGQCDRMITPACLRALYSTPFGETSFGNNTLGIVEYTPQAFLQSDLDMYFNEFESRLKGKKPVVTLLDNGVVQTQNKSFGFNGESALDLQFAMTLIYPQQATLYQVGDLLMSASFNNFLDSIDGTYCDFMGGNSVDPNVDAPYAKQVGCGTSDTTNVISTSYGYNEADLGIKYVQRQCAEYMKLALRGVSVLYSSGDAGVAGNGGQCIDAATGAFNTGGSGMFNPSFPGSCPWVTSVGATQILNGSTVRGAESACEEVIFSGGGFSNVFPMPGYQNKTLAGYFAQTPPPYGHERYNNSRTVRAFPDVAANGARYVTAVNGKFTLSFGTSASAPVFASILTLINEKRLTAGKSPVGFINPVLYEHPEVLNDVTNGKNPGCGTDGFQAVKGWDPVTGLGTPNYQKMVDLFMGLP